MSYYEIYNDRVFDLFEPPEKRTNAGLAIRDNNGKTVVCGLTERPCASLKEFESLYSEANINRSTSATKLNAHSSRSHAILCVKLTQTTESEVRFSTASAIDLAGSEDNRRTDNNKDRLVESASINKSLFVLAQCVEAISKKQARIPYRESKMTRILSLGQNNGLTVMILNLAPVQSYHLDTLSSLNFANRTKKIEVNEVENQPFLREQPAKSKHETALTAANAPSMHRQPLRPKLPSQSSHLKDATAPVTKPAKQFSVYSDKAKAANKSCNAANTGQARVSAQPIRSPKRNGSEVPSGLARPSKICRPNEGARITKTVEQVMSKDAIEALIEKKVVEALAERADHSTVSSGDPISDEVQRRLEVLEKRVEGQETERAEGLQYLLMAKQHQVRGEQTSALKMYQLALPYFPENKKLVRKVVALQEKLSAKSADIASPSKQSRRAEPSPTSRSLARRNFETNDRDESYHEALTEQDGLDDDDFVYRPRTKIRRPHNARLTRPMTLPSLPPLSMECREEHTFPLVDDDDDELASALSAQTPRTRHLLRIINTKDVSQIKLLKGVGSKKADAIVNCLCDLDDAAPVTSLDELGKLRGIGAKTVESARRGLG